MIRLSDEDYATKNLSVRRAFAKASEASGPLPKPLRDPISVRWGAFEIVTADIFEVPTMGRVKLQFLEVEETARQGVDIQAQPGSKLADGTQVPLLRTWFDPDLPDAVEYDFVAEDQLMRTCNVYEVTRAEEVHVERWTENAGMWIEERGPLDRIYHCSHGVPDTPAMFEALVYRLTVQL